MAELSPEDVQRLAREFLAVRAGEAETLALTAAVEGNANAALEFLALTQSACGEPAAAGLDAVSAAQVAERVETLIRAKAARPWYLFFRRRPTVKREAAAGPPPKAAAPSGPPVVMEGYRGLAAFTEEMEDTAPITTAPPKAPAVPVRPAASNLTPPAPAPLVFPAPLPPPARPTVARPVTARRPLRRRFGVWLGLASFLLLLALGALEWLTRTSPSVSRRPVSRPALASVPRPAAPGGLQARAEVVAPALSGPLPAELPAEAVRSEEASR